MISNVEGQATEGYKWVNFCDTQLHNTTRPDMFWPRNGSAYQRTPKECIAIGMKKRQDCGKLAERQDSSIVLKSQGNILKLEQSMRCSFFTVHSQGRIPGETQGGTKHQQKRHLLEQRE